MNQSSPNQPGAGRRILVVDDHPEYIELVAYHLEDVGFVIETCLSGQEAIDRLQGPLPDVVILDINMGKLTGYEVLERMRANPRTATLPVIMVTAMEDSEFRVRGLETGADGYITKPPNGDELRAKVLSLCKLRDAYRQIEDERQQFTSMLVHDLRSPLTSMTMFLELLGEELLGPLNEKQREAVESCQTSTRHQLEIVDSILDLGQLQAGQLRPTFESLDVGVLVHESVRSLGVQAESKGIQLRANVQGDLPGLNADRRMLRQVLCNLIDNAIRHTAEGGKVIVSASRAPSCVRLSVKDTGSGIRPDDLPHIFQPYTQNTDGPRGKSGLGLVITRLMVEAHQGSIAAESTIGAGSTFTVKLPTAATTSGE